MAGAVFGAKRFDLAKWAFFILLAAGTLVVVWTDERYFVSPHDPRWRQIAPFKGPLLAHALFGATALGLGATQFSDRLRSKWPAVHRSMGRIYVGAVLIAAPLGGYIGYHFAGTPGGIPKNTVVEQVVQSAAWLLTTLTALICILKRNVPAHRAWMMRSYGLATIFVISRLPDALPSLGWTSRVLDNLLWCLTLAAFLVPDLALTFRELSANAAQVESPERR